MSKENRVVFIRFHARGGQGGVTAAQLAVESFDGPGRAQPKFGAERMGSPTAAYAAMSKNPKLVQLQTEIYTPEIVGVLDDSLLKELDVTEGMPPGGILIVNTEMTFDQIKKFIKRTDINIGIIDATSLSIKVLGREITNTAILGAIAKASDVFTLDGVKKALFKVFTKGIAEKNVQLIQEAFDTVEFIKTDTKLDLEKGVKKEWSHVKPDLLGYKDLDTGAIWYIPGGSEKVKTGEWGPYDIKHDIEKCINCQRCFLTCPDLSIIREKQSDGTWKVVGVDKIHCKSCRNCVEVCPKGALTAELKKTGVEA
ncbi:MAG: 2-oxoacid:acceptor oxidoreductase family protein [Candidatus Helarchaeota archaeon]|nr:2-oxoacid:acceptor oxidoreductase family protein [Candidatus Helarchaeota archaeon]